MLPFIKLDADHIQGLLEGKESSFKALYACFAPKVYRFAFSFLKEKSPSEEIVQEVFLTLWENRQKFNAEKPLEPYIFTIAKRLVVDQLRKNMTSTAFRSKFLNYTTELHNQTEETIIWSDLLNYAEKAISELPLQQQTVFKLSRLEGLSYDEIGERMNLSKNTVKNHLIAALKKLKAQINHQELMYLLLVLALL